MKALVVTNMYPHRQWPSFGIFVQHEVTALRELGVEIDILFLNGRRSKLAYPRGYLRLWRQLARNRYDLLHAHYILAGLVARAQRRHPVVLTHWGVEVLATWQAPVSRAATSWFDAVIVQSEEMREKLEASDAHVIPAGIDLDRFRPIPKEQAREAAGLPADRKLVAWVGESFRPEKRYDLAEAAVDILKARDPAVSLVLVTGKPQPAIPAYLNACDALLLTSDYEGSPNVVKEAMACNLPVVSTPVGDVRRVIGATPGCYVCAQDPGELADHLEHALAFGGRTNGRDAVQALGREEAGRKVLAVYEQTVRAHRPAAALDCG